MNYLILILFMVLTPIAHSACVVGGTSIPVGETISIQDAYLVKVNTEAYETQGYSKEEIEHLVKTSDWTHAVLICQPMYKLNLSRNSTEVPFEFLEEVEPALVPISHQVDWINQSKARKGN